MRKLSLFSFLVLSVAFSGHAQVPRTLDDVFANVLASEFPKWKRWKAGAPFSGHYATTLSKRMHGEWKKGDSRLSLSVALADTPEAMELEFRRFFIRQIVPKGNPISGFGERAAMLSTCDFVDAAFSRYNVSVKIHYSFRRSCDRPVPSWEVTAPPKEIERITKLAQALYAAIDSERSMTPCRNDFLNTYFPRPEDDQEKMLEAASNGSTQAIRSLIAAGVTASGTDAEGNSPLHIAARNGCLAAIQALVDTKVDLNARNLRGHTPLMVAASFKDMEAVQLFLNVGADLGSQDQYGWNAADHAVSGPPISTLFPRPSEKGPRILKLLESYGVRPTK